MSKLRLWIAMSLDGFVAGPGQARAAAGGKDVSLAGGAQAARRYLREDLVDQMDLNLVPLFLGDGERLFDNLGLGNPHLTHVSTVAAPGVLHLRFERA